MIDLTTLATELATALNAFQAELVVVGKDATNPFFKSKYADLSSIMLKAQPVLTKHGLAIVQLPSSDQVGNPTLTTIIIHKSGQSIQASMPLLLTKNDPQGHGSAITYARRYAYAAALQIVIDEDDDGNRASQPAAHKQPYKPLVHRAVEFGTRAAPATERQRNSIKKSLENLNIEPEHMNEYLQSTFDVTTPLSRVDADKVIDAIITGDK